MRPTEACARESHVRPAKVVYIYGVYVSELIDCLICGDCARPSPQAAAPMKRSLSSVSCGAVVMLGCIGRVRAAKEACRRWYVSEAGARQGAERRAETGDPGATEP